MRGIEAPHTAIEKILKQVETLELKEGVLTGSISKEGANSLLSFGGNNGGPEISNPGGSVSIQIKEDVITEYNLKLEGIMSFNGNDFDLDRATKTTFSKKDETNFKFPDAAKSKLTAE